MSARIISPVDLKNEKNLVVGVFENELKITACQQQLAFLKPYFQLGDIQGKKAELHVIYPRESSHERVIILGLGEKQKCNHQVLLQCMNSLVKKIRQLKIRHVCMVTGTLQCSQETEEQIIRKIHLTARIVAYRFDVYKTVKNKFLSQPAVTWSYCSMQPKIGLQAIRQSEAVAAGIDFSRTLANQPGNKLFPERLAREAMQLTKEFKTIKARTMFWKELEKKGFNTLLAVGSGSIHKPVLIELSYAGGKKSEKPIALVGKGITFDSGGISLKPAAKMDQMRFDMSGAAAVLGVFKICAALRLPINLLGIIPSAENLPSGSACRPGDIVTSLSGKTIEILNTDAEGRLILADALTYACSKRPRVIVDLATLTGAVIVALGKVAIGLMSNHQPLADQILKAAEQSGEKAWQLPLWEEYRSFIKSDVADLANIGRKEGAGTIVGGIFLEAFVEETPWVHLDIAGTAYGETGLDDNKGATGAGVQLLVEWLSQEAAANRKK